MSGLAVAVREQAERAAASGLDGLRRALASAGAAAREEVLVDFVEDDLRAAEAAVDDLRAYVDALGAALRAARARRRDLLPLARVDEPARTLDGLQGTLSDLRRRVALVAMRLP